MRRLWAYVIQERAIELACYICWHPVFPIAWITGALRQNQQEPQWHTVAVGRFQARCDGIRARIEAMYLERLDGRIDTLFFDRRASEWRNEQSRLTRRIQDHRESDKSRRRRLLNFLLSSCSWKTGELDATFRQPSDLSSHTIKAQSEAVPVAGSTLAEF
jgi:site-specific DNA recombinase